MVLPRIDHDGPSVMILQFADDSLIFLPNSEEDVGNLQSILLMFNLPKSRLMLVGDVPNLYSLPLLFGCSMTELPGLYLGLPLGAKVKSKHLWDLVVDQVEQRLATCKGRYPSKGGDITLIKSALSNLPVYFMFLFHAPSLVLCKIEKIIANFIWHTEGDKKFHLVNKNQICQSYKNGGLGIRALKEMNRALLSKWLWRHGDEPNE